MLVPELVIILLNSILGSIASILVIRQSLHSPIIEMKILAVAIILTTISFWLYLPLAILSDSSGIHPLGDFFAKLGFATSGLYLLCFQLVLLIPTLKLRYSSQFFLIAIVAINMLFVPVLFYTTEYRVMGEFYRAKMDPLGAGLLFLSLLIFFVLLVKRLREINSLVKQENVFLLSPRLMILILSIGFFWFAIVVNFIFFSDIPLPNQMQYFPFSLWMFIWIYGLSRNKHILFLIPVKLHAVIIAERRSGLVIFAESLTKDAPAEVLLGSLFTALNLSLKNQIQSQQDLEAISFGDKVVHVAPGKTVTTFFITSAKTLMTETLSRHLTNTFEKLFQDKLKSLADGRINTAEYKDFKAEIGHIKPYFAL